MKNDTTIAAIATPPGHGAIGIIKISGPAAFSSAARIFKPKNGPKATAPDFNPETGRTSIPSHRLYYGNIVHPDTGHILDEALFAFMRAPHSYTREDVVEIQAHAGPVALRVILNLILESGARLAEPGEFTRRAFLNGRIDLTQAEAVIDTINARSEIALEAAARQMNGELKMTLLSIDAVLSQLQVRIEAGIDFPEDVADIDWNKTIRDRLQHQVIRPIEELIRTYELEHVFRDGLHLAIIGRPNVGKSSLMNCLLGKDRAIVTPRPGTTRDFIEDTLQICGVPINLIDTAGLHDTQDPIETLGIQKTRQGIEDAHQVLFVVEGQRALTDSDLQIHSAYHPKSMILVINKIDLVRTEPSPLEIPKQWNGIPTVRVSALERRGIDDLKKMIAQRAAGGGPGDREHSAIPNLRHKIALEQALSAARAVEAGIAEQRPAELIAIDLKEARDGILSVTGRRTENDLLETIFKQFCIGK